MFEYILNGFSTESTNVAMFSLLLKKNDFDIEIKCHYLINERIFVINGTNFDKNDLLEKISKIDTVPFCCSNSTNFLHISKIDKQYVIKIESKHDMHIVVTAKYYSSDFSSSLRKIFDTVSGAYRFN